MKTLRLIAMIICLLITGAVSYAQPTPEQLKQAEEAQKKAMEMMQNNPQFKEAMEMMEGAEEQMKQERMQKQLENEKSQKDAAKDHLEEYYWRNKVASDTNGKFSNWQWGDVQIAYYKGDGKRGKDGKLLIEDYAVIGSINSQGAVNMGLPKSVETNRIISKGLFPEMHEILNDEVNFSNPNTPYFYYGFILNVLRGDTVLGQLYMGSSERATHNLASPANLKYGDEGYLVYWAYSGGACTVTYSMDNQAVSIFEGEAEKTVDQYTRVNLNFQPGWNLVKIEVNGNHTIGNRTRWKWKTYDTVENMPSDARYYFKYDD